MTSTFCVGSAFLKPLLYEKGKSFGGKAYEIALVRHDRRKRKVNSDVQVYEWNLIPLYGYKAAATAAWTGGSVSLNGNR